MISPNRKFYGIWLDDNKALIITFDVDKTLIMPVFKDKEPRDNGKTRLSESDKKLSRNQYYNDILSALPKGETLLIIGPDQSKLHLKEFLERKSDKIKNIVTKVAGHMTTSDIIFTVRSFFLREKAEVVLF